MSNLQPNCCLKKMLKSYYAYVLATYNDNENVDVDFYICSSSHIILWL